MAGSIRSFIAIELASSILEEVARLQDDLQVTLPDRALRWTRPDGIHLTLKFLGNVEPEQILSVTGALEKACAEVPAFTIQVRNVGCFPNARRPRVLWVGVEEGTGQLARLQERLERNLEVLGFEPERRGFHPHLTLARASRSARPADLRQVGAWADEAEPVELGSMEVTSVSLMRSDLRPTGAVYARLKGVALGG